MPKPTVVSYARTFPVPLDQAFDGVLTLPLTEFFARRYGPIPRVRSTESTAEWGEVGRTRIIRLADGGSLHEELTEVTRPSAFGYVLSDIRGPMKPLASRIDGRFTFAPDGAGTRIEWSWALHPRSVLSAPLLPIFGRIWGRMAKRAFDRLDRILPEHAAG
ncbi:MAG TPA: SRPBCC family protein [Jatrophihabitantaceae bacterium]|nr:SRPBCC family protein [Jatrophihabitantaceae bacterium]